MYKPDKDPEDWEFSKINDIIYEQNGFKTWADAKKKWGADWKDQRYKLAAQFAFDNRDNVYSERQPDKAAATLQAELERSKSASDQVIVIDRPDLDDMLLRNGNVLAFYANKFHEVDGEVVPTVPISDFWTSEEIPTAGIASEGGVEFKKNKKPELLMKRIIEMCSKPGDRVLDCFLGSGTTAAVAHKLGRKWIGIEIGDHAETLCIPRLEKVVSGDDQTGISKIISWQGGGGFRYCELEESLIETDKEGNVDLNLHDEKLIESVCINQGFRFLDGKLKFHGSINDKKFCYVTEEMITPQKIDDFADELSNDESLIIYCTKFMADIDLASYPNIEIKKIPFELTRRFQIV